jgi:glycosyltransferase involved in cell wall biosynthesis
MTPLLFSIVIPTRNRKKSLAMLLASIDRQTERSFEVIVVNDGSTDGTEISAAEFPAVRCITIPHSGPAIARNRGAQEAHGDIIVCTDDDCIVPEDWLARYAEVFRTMNVQAAAGSIENVLPENPYSVVYQMTTEYFQKKLNSVSGRSYFVTSNNFACRKDAFIAVRGFDERFQRGAEDRELSARLIAEGCSIRFVPEIVIRHAHPFSFRSFVRHTFQHGKGSFLFQTIARERRYTSRHLRLMEYAGLLLEVMKKKSMLAPVWMLMELSHLAGYCAAALVQRKKGS